MIGNVTAGDVIELDLSPEHWDKLDGTEEDRWRGLELTISDARTMATGTLLKLLERPRVAVTVTEVLSVQ